MCTSWPDRSLEKAKRVRPDIGVFDIGVPDLNGYEPAERIRREAWGKNMTLIAVTGWGQESDKRHALLVVSTIT
jgi:DNA-binding response OmpR family regulator